MKDEKEKYVQFNLKMPIELMEALEEYANYSFRTKSEVVRTALIELLRAKGSVGTWW